MCGGITEVDKKETGLAVTLLLTGKAFGLVLEILAENSHKYNGMNTILEEINWQTATGM